MLFTHLINTKSVLLLLAAALLATHGTSFASEDKSYAEELSEINTFSMGMNGFAGGISKGEKMYNEIIKNDNRIPIFNNILKSSTSTPEAKIYALCGLVKAGVNKETLLSFKAEASNVSILKGDILREFPFQEVYEDVISNGC